MTDEWCVGKLDLDAYLGKIGYSGPLEPSDAALAALHRAHLSAMPFENLDILLGRGIKVDLESIQDKMVRAGRGGYCYEHGQLFGAALERLGFRVDRLLARTGPDDEPVRARTHMTLVVRTGSGAWLADVGFGSGSPAPLALRGGHQDIDGWVYEVVADEAGRNWKLRELEGADWVTRYRAEDQPVYPPDVVMANHFTATYPESWFTWQPVVVRREPAAIRSVVGRTYTVTSPGYIRDRRTLSDEEFAAALTEVFGLTLTDDERAAV